MLKEKIIFIFILNESVYATKDEVYKKILCLADARNFFASHREFLCEVAEKVHVWLFSDYKTKEKGSSMCNWKVGSEWYIIGKLKGFG